MPTPDDLSQLLPQPIELKIGDKALSLTPLKVSELSAFSRAVAPVIGAFEDGSLDLFGLIANHTETVVTAVSIAVREPREWINVLTVGELVLLAAKVIEVNADFFTRGVMPSVTPALGTLGALTPMVTAGSPSSSA